MIQFSILKKSRKSRARFGILKTPHGEVETPCLVPVATQAVVKTLTSEDAEAAGCRMLIANTFHLHLRPGETIVKRMGGLHRFMNWVRPLMTDSGGFQVFSLGFGRDLGVGKILKYFPGRTHTRVHAHAQPKRVTITEQGVWFHSPLDGAKLFLGPEESIRIQEHLGADIMFAFDECTSPTASRAYAARALHRTHRWALRSLHARRSQQALFGIVQGSRFKSLREESARFIGALDFDGFGIGGDLGHRTETLSRILDWVIPLLPPKKPRHLLGIGAPHNLTTIISRGIDLFDCTIPTHYGRRGIAFTARGRLNLAQSAFLKDRRPIEPRCACMTCGNYTRAYLAHLLRAKEMTALTLLTVHNLFHFHARIAELRTMIARGRL